MHSYAVITLTVSLVFVLDRLFDQDYSAETNDRLNNEMEEIATYN